MILTQQQVNEVGEGLNAAMQQGFISVQMRNRLWIDVNAPPYSVGDSEMIDALNEAKRAGLYVEALSAYQSILQGSTPAPPAPPVPHTPIPTVPNPSTNVPNSVTPAPVVDAPISGGVVLSNPPEITFVNTFTGLKAAQYISRNDDGGRYIWNWQFPPGATGTHSLPWYPQVGWAIETEGAFSISGVPSYNAGPGPWDWPNKPGKALKFYPLGFGGYQGRRYVTWTTGQVGRGHEFSTADEDPNNYIPKMRIAPEGVLFSIGGKWRRLTIDAEGRPAFEDADE